MSLLRYSCFKGVMVLVVLTAMAGITLGGRPQVVSAHPLGNFTINHYSRIELTADTISLRYILDMAEIPAFQEAARIDMDKDSLLSEKERSDYLDQKLHELHQGLHLSIGQSSVNLTPMERDMSVLPGQGGLSTLRLNLLFQGKMPQSRDAGELVLEYRDENYPQRIGWKEIIVKAGDGITLVNSSAPQTDLSNELQAYPADLAGSPPDQNYAQATFVHADSRPSRDLQSPETSNQPGAPPEDLLSSLLAKNDLSLPLVAISLMAALGLGALHAMSPGHGKTIMAAYLVGAEGTARHAVFLGLTVTVSHTLGVVVLGLVVLYASHIIAPETLYPWLGMFSGVAVIAIGIGLLLNRMRSGHAHAGQGHPHRHPHPHSHQSFGAQNPAGSRITWRSLAALGVVGGLVPSTSALVLLLAAISMQRVGVGLLLVLMFSAGMALVLGGVGLALVYAAKTVEKASFQKRWIAGLTSKVSLMAAVAVLVSGAVMMARGLSQLGIG